MKPNGATVLDEFREIIEVLSSEKADREYDDSNSIQLSERVLKQLCDYVTLVARAYRDNFFHNFEHASHVTMSVGKLLSRSVAPD